MRRMRGEEDWAALHLVAPDEYFGDGPEGLHQQALVPLRHHLEEEEEALIPLRHHLVLGEHRVEVLQLVERMRVPRLPQPTKGPPHHPALLTSSSSRPPHLLTLLTLLDPHPPRLVTLLNLPKPSHYSPSSPSSLS